MTDGFDDYVRGHWSRLVRAAILLGCTPTEVRHVPFPRLVSFRVHRQVVDVRPAPGTMLSPGSTVRVTAFR